MSMYFVKHEDVSHLTAGELLTIHNCSPHSSSFKIKEVCQTANGFKQRHTDGWLLSKLSDNGDYIFTHCSGRIYTLFRS